MRCLFKNSMFGALAMACTLTSGSTASQAAEGASSHYLPGANGDIFLATPPQPGFMAANTYWYQSGNASVAVLDGSIDTNLDVSTFLNITALTYTFEQPVLGGTYTFGAAVPIGYADLDATVTGLPGGSFRISEDSFDLSDIAIIPVQFNWTVGLWSFKLAETIIAPTGGYDLANSVDLGRNYWSFDTVGAVTWFDPARALEVSVAPGVMVNTENQKTDYKTGTEFHVDFTANQFVAPNLAVGVRGYYYRQITGDSGRGAALGDFKSESFGAGPGFVWIPKAGGGKLTAMGKWLHDFSAENRFKADTFTLTASWKF